MSRVGKLPIKIVKDVKVDIEDDVVNVQGPKGKLLYKIPVGISCKIENSTIIVNCDEKLNPKAHALHGLSRTLISNMVVGVSTGFTKNLEIQGVGYKAGVQGRVLNLSLGFSHPIDYKLPEGIDAKVQANTKIILSGADKMLVGMTAAKIRSFRPPEPYQGKGIRLEGEYVIRKAGKSAAGVKA